MCWWQLPVEPWLAALFGGFKRRLKGYCALEMMWNVIYWVIHSSPTGEQTVRETMNLFIVQDACVLRISSRASCFQKQHKECLAHVQSLNYWKETEAIYSQRVFRVSGDKQNKNTPSVSSVPSVFSPFILPHSSCRAFSPSQPATQLSVLLSELLHPTYSTHPSWNFYLQWTLSLFHALPTSGVSGRELRSA